MREQEKVLVQIWNDQGPDEAEAWLELQDAAGTQDRETMRDLWATLEMLHEELRVRPRCIIRDENEQITTDLLGLDLLGK